MEKQPFIAIVERYYRWIECLEKAAFKIHDGVNQKYDNILPYGFHLKMTASYVSRYGYLVAEDEADILILYASAYLHDSIEDTQMTYNDVTLFMDDFIKKNMWLPEDVVVKIKAQVPDLVYALTNEKGRSRKERANAAYYKGICETPLASFVKMCDRMANIQYTTMFVFANRMLDVYQKEHPGFIAAISEGAVTPIPEVMRHEADRLLSVEAYVISNVVKDS